MPKTASVADIKKRYRELARQFHPDVNKDKPDVAKRFSEITTAYKTLTHPDERATYDADLVLREQRTARAAARAQASTFPGAASSSGAYTRTPPPPRSGMGSRPAPGGASLRPGAAPAGGGADTVRLLAEAQAAFVRGKFVEARALCEQVLRRDRQNGAAYEILGDVYRIQNKTDEAINMYTMALQFNPRNYAVMERLERLARSSGGAGGGVTAQRTFFDNRGATAGPRPAAARAHSGNDDTFVRDKRPLKMLLGGMVGYGLAFLSIGYLAVAEQRPTHAPIFFGPIATWSVTLLAVMAVAGALFGFTMAATAAVRPIGDELILQNGRAGSGGAHVPLGLILIVLSFVSFYAAALLYAVIGALQESLTPSLLRVFGVVIGAVLLLAAVYEPGRSQVLLFGGNVVFLALLFGWFLGDFFRPDGF